MCYAIDINDSFASEIVLSNPETTKNLFDKSRRMITYLSIMETDVELNILQAHSVLQDYTF